MADPIDVKGLDRSVAKSEQFITEIKAVLTEQLRDQGDAANSWLNQIKQIELKRNVPRVVIGVVGATGSGKSSIINAVLGETQLVPTNCMRACTAVVTEISYNRTPSNYRAIIEFVSPEQWRAELELLLGDVITDEKITLNISDDGSEAGIAMAKIQAVYPHINKNNLESVSVTDLLNCDYIKNLLGHEIEFNTFTAKELHSKIQKYVDSKEKLTKDFASNGLRASSTLDEIAYWPLIRAVRIQMKASVLESGSVLVDLPGIADSNAARAAIAQKYIQNCAALWVVAPIIRAVDDKSARFLLGESFKRQLWRDGTLQRVTFICSKADEISISEARAALERYPEFGDKLAQIDEDRTGAMKQRGTLLRSLAEVKESIEQVSKTQKELDQEETEYKNLEGSAKDGQPSHPLVRVEVLKRQANVDEDVSPIKKTKYESHLATSFESPGKRPSPILNDTSSMQIQYRQDTTKPRLTLPAIKTKIEEVKANKRELKVKKKDMRSNEKSLKQALTDNKALIADLGAREWITCVLGRNQVSSHAIRIDFALGVRDIAQDEEDEADEEEEDEDEDSDLSGTGTVLQAGSCALPVFCVSARGYHKIVGSMSGEKIATCFDSLDETGIPGLREHIIKLGKDRMVLSLQSYVDEATRLLTSLKLWSSGNVAVTPTKNSETQSDEDFCLGLVNDFVSGVLRTGTTVMDTIAKTVDSQVLATLPSASRSASKVAVATAMKWVAPLKSETPGLRYETFKAVIRRDGAFKNHQKAHDFNADLSKLYMRRIDARWNEVFNVQVDKIFRKALTNSASSLDAFVEPFADRLSNEQHGSSSTVRQTFEEQVKLFTKSLGGVFRVARKSIEDHQKEANRLEESVKTQMKNIYSILEMEKGHGSYNRCREKMEAYIESNKSVMFNKLTRGITMTLQNMLKEVRSTLQSDLEAHCESLKRDCRYFCQKSRDFEGLPEVTQKKIIQILKDADIDLVDPDQTSTDTRNSVGKENAAGGGDQRGDPFVSLRSMTPVLMTTKTEDSIVSEDESDSSSEDDSTDEDD